MDLMQDSLHNFLHVKKSTDFTFGQKLQMAEDIAMGLQFLHNNRVSILREGERGGMGHHADINHYVIGAASRFKTIEHTSGRISPL
jgi:hypothetical protein